MFLPYTPTRGASVYRLGLIIPGESSRRCYVALFAAASAFLAIRFVIPASHASIRFRRAEYSIHRRECFTRTLH